MILGERALAIRGKKMGRCMLGRHKQQRTLDAEPVTTGMNISVRDVPDRCSQIMITVLQNPTTPPENNRTRITVPTTPSNSQQSTTGWRQIHHCHADSIFEGNLVTGPDLVKIPRGLVTLSRRFDF
jgi:hypothetical protein